MSDFYKKISEVDFNEKVIDSVHISQECLDLFDELNITYEIGDRWRRDVLRRAFSPGIDLRFYGRKYIEFGNSRTFTGVCIELPDEWFLVLKGLPEEYNRRSSKEIYLCDQLDGLKKLLLFWSNTKVNDRHNKKVYDPTNYPLGWYSGNIDESVSNKKNLYELLVDEEKFLSSHKLEKINNKEFKKVELFLSGYKVELEITVIYDNNQRYSGFISNSLYKYSDNKDSDQSTLMFIRPSSYPYE